MSTRSPYSLRWMEAPLQQAGNECSIEETSIVFNGDCTTLQESLKLQGLVGARRRGGYLRAVAVHRNELRHAVRRLTPRATKAVSPP
jgi:hypothetical protein